MLPYVPVNSRTGGALPQSGMLSTLATQRFFADLISASRMIEPPTGTMAHANYMASRAGAGGGGRSAGEDEEESFLSPVDARLRVEFARTNDALAPALRKIYTDMTANGFDLEITEGGKKLELDDDTRRLFDLNMPRVAEEVHLQLSAIGMFALEVVRDSRDESVPEVRVLQPLDYLVSMSRKHGRSRFYRVYSRDGASELKNVRLYVLREPDTLGYYHGDIDALIEPLQIRDAMLDNEAYGHYHNTHIPPAQQHASNATRDTKNAVINASIYADQDAAQEIKHQHQQVASIYRENTNATIDAVQNQAAEIAASTRAHLERRAGGANMQHHPSVRAAESPPYASTFTVPMDMQMAVMPTQQLHPKVDVLRSLIAECVNVMLSIPPQLMSAAGEKFASETSLVLRLYNASIVRRTNDIRTPLSDIMKSLSERSLRRILKGQESGGGGSSSSSSGGGNAKAKNKSASSNSKPKEGKDDDPAERALQKAERVARNERVAQRMEGITVEVVFKHVPIIEPADVQMLYTANVIGEDTMVQLMASRFFLPPNMVLDTPAKRDRERKRRLENQVEETQALAVAGTVEVQDNGPEAGGKPNVKRANVKPISDSFGGDKGKGKDKSKK